MISRIIAHCGETVEQKHEHEIVTYFVAHKYMNIMIGPMAHNPNKSGIIFVLSPINGN